MTEFREFLFFSRLDYKERVRTIFSTRILLAYLLLHRSKVSKIIRWENTSIPSRYYSTLDYFIQEPFTAHSLTALHSLTHSLTALTRSYSQEPTQYWLPTLGGLLLIPFVWNHLEPSISKRMCNHLNWRITASRSLPIRKTSSYWS